MGGVVDLEFLATQLGVPQVVHARVALREHDLSPDVLGLLKPPAGHGDRVLGKGAPHPAAGPAAEAVGVMVGHLDQIGGDAPDGFTGLFVDPAMPAEVAGIVIRDLAVRTDPEIESGQKLGQVDYVDPLLLEGGVRRLVVEGAGAVGAAGQNGSAPVARMSSMFRLARSSLIR